MIKKIKFLFGFKVFAFLCEFLDPISGFYWQWIDINWFVLEFKNARQSILNLKKYFYWAGFCSQSRGLHWDRKRN
jgi:hypothetical protein